MFLQICVLCIPTHVCANNDLQTSLQKQNHGNKFILTYSCASWPHRTFRNSQRKFAFPSCLTHEKKGTFDAVLDTAASTWRQTQPQTSVWGRGADQAAHEDVVHDVDEHAAAAAAARANATAAASSSSSSSSQRRRRCRRDDALLRTIGTGNRY